MARRSAPPPSRCVANEWRSRCGFTGLVTPCIVRLPLTEYAVALDLRKLVEMKVMRQDEVTWPAIRDWMKRNPVQARDVMRKNERYIFFKDTRSAVASGSQGVPLTAQRSLAVDPVFTPYGTPVWIDTARPLVGKPGATEIYRRLMIAQDSGSAIKGPARGDVFYGAGNQAADWAGRMNAGGRAVVLVPNKT